MGGAAHSISVVIPAFNSGAFLREAVLSVHAQTHPVDEIIVVDDGSTDDTAQVCRSFKGEVRYIFQSNAGPAAARNRGIDEARGALVAFLDADDTWLPEKITRQLHALDKYPEAALIAGDMAETDAAREIVVPSVLAKHGLLSFYKDLAGAPIPDALRRLLAKNFIPTGTVVVQKRALITLGAFNESIRYGEDLELWARVAAHYPIICLPEVLMLRRQHAANSTKATDRLLADLVTMTRIIHGWGEQALRQQGVNSRSLIANAQNDRAYYRFTQNDFPDARRLFAASLREQVTVRALVYLLASMPPSPIARRLRSVKQIMFRTAK